MGTTDNRTNEHETTEYTGACMEVAGIESCGLGYQAQPIPEPDRPSKEQK